MSIFDSQEKYIVLAKVTPFAIFILMIFGAYVKAIGAGLACPDWPLCYNQLIPIQINNDPLSWVLMEYLHRLIALGVTLIILGIAFFAYSHRNTDVRGMQRLFLSLALVSLFFVQIILGGLTVLMSLNEFIVTTHLAIATVIFGLSIIHFYWINIEEIKA